MFIRKRFALIGLLMVIVFIFIVISVATWMQFGLLFKSEPKLGPRDGPEPWPEPDRRTEPDRRPETDRRPEPEPGPPPTSTQVIDKIVKELEWGNIVFNTPTSMQLKKTETIELLLSHSVSIKELQTQLEKASEIDSAIVRISNRMKAQLSGTGFQIEALFPEAQTVSSKGVIQWKWYVTPTEHGLQHLHLTLSAILTEYDTDTPYVIETFARKIDVEISLAQRASSFFSKNWKWLWAAILVPIVGYLWRRYYKAKQKVT